MAVCLIPGGGGGKSHRPLTAPRIVRGAAIVAFLVTSAFIIMIFLAPITCLLVRLFSVHYSRVCTSFIFGQWLAMWPFFFEKINRTKMLFTGERVPPGERVLLICNHRTEVDWMYLWSLALRKGRIGNVKYIVKGSVRNVPILGWVLHILEFLLVDRNWQVDALEFDSLLSTFRDRCDPLWLILFPEGTDYTEQKCIRSQKFAEDNSLPRLTHVLLPRTKGFTATLDYIRDSIDAVYDITVGYKHRCPLFMDNAFGTDPAEVHMHIKRVSISDVPISESEASAWLIKRFHEKDELLDKFYRDGRFCSEEVGEGELDTVKGLVPWVACILGTCLFLTCIFFASKWVKIYVASSCVYLAAVTYFNYRPTPIFDKLPWSRTPSG